MPCGRKTPRAPRVLQQEEDALIIQCEIQQVHNTTIRETGDFYKAQKIVKDNCRRLTEIIEWINVQYPDYYSAAVIELSEEERSDIKRFYKCTHDLLYCNLNVEVAKAFLSNKKHKEGKFTPDGNTIHYLYSHIHKYHDAIIYGSHRAKIPLPDIYEIEMTVYLDSIK